MTEANRGEQPPATRPEVGESSTEDELEAGYRQLASSLGEEEKVETIRARDRYVDEELSEGRRSAWP